MTDLHLDLVASTRLLVFPFLLPLLMFALAGPLIYLAYRSNKQRRAALLAWAASRGWATIAPPPGLARRWSGRPFGSGSSRRAGNVLTGQFGGRHGISFDYQYTTGSGKNRTTHEFHVVALSLPAPLPSLQLTPEHFGTAIARVFGGQDIEFESEDFNNAWRVQAASPRFAYDVVHARLMELLLRPDARSMRLEGPTCELVGGPAAPETIDGGGPATRDPLGSASVAQVGQPGGRPDPGPHQGGHRHTPSGHAAMLLALPWSCSDRGL